MLGRQWVYRDNKVNKINTVPHRFSPFDMQHTTLFHKKPLLEKGFDTADWLGPRC